MISLETPFERQRRLIQAIGSLSLFVCVSGAACPTTRQACSAQDESVLAVGDVLLQRASKLKEASGDQGGPLDVRHRRPRHHESMLQGPELKLHLRADGLPAGAKALFNEKLCTKRSKRAGPEHSSGPTDPRDSGSTHMHPKADPLESRASNNSRPKKRAGTEHSSGPTDPRDSGSTHMPPKADPLESRASNNSRPKKMNAQDIPPAKTHRPRHDQPVNVPRAAHPKPDGMSPKPLGKPQPSPSKSTQYHTRMQKEKSRDDGVDLSFSRSFMEEWDPIESPSMSAPLDESGFQRVAATHSEKEMKLYVRRVADSCNLKVINEGGLNGAIAWLNGTEATGSFETLKETLFKALLAASKDHWVEAKRVPGITASSAPLDLLGYVQVRALRNSNQMIKFLRRMIRNMGMRVIDQDGFDAFVKFYSDPNDSESFQKLMTDIKRAAYEHSWAELE